MSILWNCLTAFLKKLWSKYYPASVLLIRMKIRTEVNQWRSESFHGLWSSVWSCLPAAPKSRNRNGVLYVTIYPAMLPVSSISAPAKSWNWMCIHNMTGSFAIVRRQHLIACLLQSGFDDVDDRKVIIDHQDLICVCHRKSSIRWMDALSVAHLNTKRNLRPYEISPGEISRATFSSFVALL